MITCRSAPASSDTVLVGSTEYDATGEAYKSIDAAGREDRREFDALGRATKNIQNYTDGNPSTGGADEDVLVETSYTADGQVSTLVAKNSSTGDQTTRYVYGTTLEDSDIARADLLRAEIYPDSDDTGNPLGSGQDTVYDRVEFAYNRQGQVIEKTDQNGTVHEFTFDDLGRQTSDKVTTVGTGIDDAVLRLSTTFEKRGLPEKLTSYDADSGGSVVNEVELVHNDFGQLVTEYQEHESSVETSTTPKVQYTYPDGSGGHIRLQKMTYPNGRVLRAEYNTGLDDAMNRVSYLADDDNGSVGTHLADYSYLGSGSIVQVDLTQPQIRYDLAYGIGNDPYNGMDRFGRVVDLLWRNYNTSTDVVRIKHGYDRAGNRLWRKDSVAESSNKTFDELYSYDGMYQLTNMQRGNLVVGAEEEDWEILSSNFAEDWALDPTGNWSTYKQDTNGNGTWNLTQSRTHNKANEITAIASASTHVAHDAAGNMTTIPKPDDWDDHFDLTFDAWNRLVKVEDSGTTVAEYEYDARNSRVLKLTYESGILDETRDFYFNEHWQCLEERVEPSSGSSSSGGSLASAERQFLWGLRYIDAPVLCDRDTTGDGTLDERVYYLNDANMNVTALVDADGGALERYVYDPYGRATIYDAAWSTTRGTSSHDNTRLYTGRRLDRETGLCYYRARYYCGPLGRFVGRDPHEIWRKASNLYAYARSRPLVLVDPSGEIDFPPTVIPAPTLEIPTPPASPPLSEQYPGEDLIQEVPPEPPPEFIPPECTRCETAARALQTRGRLRWTGRARECHVSIVCLPRCIGGPAGLARPRLGGRVEICIDWNSRNPEIVMEHELVHARQYCDERIMLWSITKSKCAPWEKQAYERSCRLAQQATPRLIPPGRAALDRCVECGRWASCRHHGTVSVPRPACTDLEAELGMFMDPPTRPPSAPPPPPFPS
ncbi:MAG: RHS repeat-associated core domain-containing protein [Planctomycetes bacterium]|nr:RHS repeat-associated core domain-containing protein [Planctomycetota bacterium]